MTGKLALLHKGGSKTDLPSHWRPVVFLNCTNQIIGYIINERLTEMVENTHILSQAQSDFRQNKILTGASYTVSPMKTNISRNASSE
jgi:hypothetical protein